jgi:hypothetical protein
VTADIHETLDAACNAVVDRADPKLKSLRKIRYPADLKPAILHRLRTMNVTAQSLYGGLDGIGMHLALLAETSSEEPFSYI